MNAQPGIGLTFLRDVLTSFREADSSGDPGAACARGLLVRFSINPSPQIESDKIALFRFCASVAVRCMNEVGIHVNYPNILPYQKMISIMNCLSTQYRCDGDVTEEATRMEINAERRLVPSTVHVANSSGDITSVIPREFNYNVSSSHIVGPNTYDLYANAEHMFRVERITVAQFRYIVTPFKLSCADAAGNVAFRQFRQCRVQINQVDVAPNTSVFIRAPEAGGAINIRVTPNIAMNLAEPNVPGSWIRIMFSNVLYDAVNMVQSVYETPELREMYHLLFYTPVNNELSNHRIYF